MRSHQQGDVCAARQTIAVQLRDDRLVQIEYRDLQLVPALQNPGIVVEGSGTTLGPIRAAFGAGRTARLGVHLPFVGRVGSDIVAGAEILAGAFENDTAHGFEIVSFEQRVA